MPLNRCSGVTERKLGGYLTGWPVCDTACNISGKPNQIAVQEQTYPIPLFSEDATLQFDFHNERR